MGIVSAFLAISLLVHCLAYNKKKRRPRKNRKLSIKNHDIENPPEPKPQSRDRSRRLKVYRFHNTFPRPQLAMRLSGIDTTQGVTHNKWIPSKRRTSLSPARKASIGARRKSNYKDALIKPAQCSRRASHRKSEGALDFVKRFKDIKRTRPSAFNSPPQPKNAFGRSSVRSISASPESTKAQSPPPRIKAILRRLSSAKITQKARERRKSSVTMARKSRVPGRFSFANRRMNTRDDLPLM